MRYNVWSSGDRLLVSSGERSSSKALICAALTACLFSCAGGYSGPAVLPNKPQPDNAHSGQAQASRVGERQEAPAAVDSAALLKAIERRVRADYQALHECFSQRLAVDRSASGTIFVEATLGAADAISETRVVRDELKSPAVADCLADRMRRWVLSGAASAGAAAGSVVVIPVTLAAAPSQYAVLRDHVPSVGEPARRALLTRANVGFADGEMAWLSLERQPLRLAADGADRVLVVLSGKAAGLAAGDALYLPPSASRTVQPAQAAVELLLLTLRAAGVKSGKPRVFRAAKQRTVSLKDGKLRVTPFVDERSGQTRIYLGRLAAAGGLAVPEHAHATSAEVLYVLKGRGTMAVEDVERAVEPGQAIYIPAGKRHWLKVIEDIETIQVYTPAGPQQRFFHRAAR